MNNDDIKKGLVGTAIILAAGTTELCHEHFCHEAHQPHSEETNYSTKTSLMMPYSISGYLSSSSSTTTMP